MQIRPIPSGAKTMYPKLQTAQAENILFYKALWLDESCQNNIPLPWNCFNLLKGNIECSAPEFVWHVYWIIFVCLSGLYTGSSTPHHSASVELLSPTPNLASASTTDLPSRQHRLDRDLGSPHHLSPLAAMDSTRDGWVLRGCLTWMYSAVEMCHTSSDTQGHC